MAMAVLALIRFPAAPARAAGAAGADAGRPLGQIMRQPAFIVATVGAALGYGVMNLLMAATPLAMQVCGFEFGATAQVLHNGLAVLGVSAPQKM